MNIKSLILFLFLRNIVQAIVDPELTISYSRYKSMFFALVYGCSLKRIDNVKMYKHLITNGLPTVCYDLNSQLNITDSFRRYMDFHALVVLDGDCENIHLITQYNESFNIFDDKHHWLIVSDTNATIAKLTNARFNINSDVKLAVKSIEELNNTTIKKSPDEYVIYDLYNPAYAKNGTFRYGIFGSYKNSTVELNDKKCAYEQRRNMTGVTFKSMMVIPEGLSVPLDEYLNNIKDRDINTFNRYNSVLIFHCRDYYNFSLEISVTNSWGYKLADGTIDGLVRSLGKHEVDFGQAPIFPKEERIPFVDYGRSTWFLRSFLIYRNPKKEASMEIFLRPYERDVWYSLVVMIVVIIILVKITLGSKVLESYKTFINEFNWSYCMLIILGIFCQQAPSISINITSGKVILLWVFIFSMFIYQFYSASVVSSLLLKPFANIKSVYDLIDSNLKVGSDDILYNRDFFNQKSSEPVSTLLYAKRIQKENESFFMQVEVGVELVRRGGFAFLVDIARAYPLIECTFDDATICDLQEMSLLETQRVNAAFQKKSPFRDMISFCLQRMAETGVMNRQVQFWHPRKPRCVQETFTSTRVGLNEFYPALVIFAFGLGCSLLILVGEIIWHFKYNINYDRTKEFIHNIHLPHTHHTHTVGNKEKLNSKVKNKTTNKKKDFEVVRFPYLD